MGSKRAMLQNGLGDLLEREVKGVRRFVDLFAGSSVVAIHVATRFPVQVLAFDLQCFSAVLAGAVVNRQVQLNWETVWSNWYRRAASHFNSRRVPTMGKLTRAIVKELRDWCGKQSDCPITRAYGGHYFSPHQALWIDSLRATLPSSEAERTTALAALIQAVSQCAAAPGHTAQPFQPTRTAKLYLETAWHCDVAQRTRSAFAVISAQFAQKRGRSEVADANDSARQLNEGDLAFIDPPYSGVHYSRFYHVLETVARGDCGEVSGVGRYPAFGLRPWSKYSVRSESTSALETLLQTVAGQGAKAVLTFPDHDCSNGLSGDIVRGIARKYFCLREQIVQSQFSTLGGTGDERKDEAGRKPRKNARELILVLRPR